MFCHEMWMLGRMNVPYFYGDFPLDKLHVLNKPPVNFIVNTHTSNLPDEHWLAVSYLEGSILCAFDPFGFYYPHLLRVYLHKLHAKVFYNRMQYQKISEKFFG